MEQPPGEHENDDRFAHEMLETERFVEGIGYVIGGYKVMAEEYSAKAGIPYEDVVRIMLSPNVMRSMADQLRKELLREEPPEEPPIDKPS